MDDDDFLPRLGRMRAKGAKREKTYLGRIVAATRRAGARPGMRYRRFDGSRIGRGASIARVLGHGDRHAAFRSRRVVVKARLALMAGKGRAGAKAHLRYIQRDGVTRDGQPGALYGAERDVADGKAFMERCDGDRHQFRFIVSAEDADQYPDLKPFVRRLMSQMEADLGTRLDWVAVDHFNTGHPHSHILLRGRDERGENLVIAREYISHGFRERAMRLATLDLGPRTDLEIEQRLRSDTGEARLTAIDRRLIRDMDAARIVGAGDRDPFQQALRAGRLQKLASMGLADHLGGDRWRLADGIEATLRRMGERGDIIRTLQRALTLGNLDRAPVDRAIFDSAAEGAAPILGRVVLRGLADELHDRHYLIVDAIDGRTHYAEIGKGEAVEPIPESAIVRIAPRTGGARQADRTIAEVAAANDGRYTIDAHLRHDATASEAFAETHVRRLEAMRRVLRNVEREPDGAWIIAPDHLDKAAEFAARQRRDRPVTVQILSPMPLDKLLQAEGATWLDRELVADAPALVRDAGFGHDVLVAQAARRRWLIAERLAEEREGQTVYRPGMLAALQRRELLRIAGRLSDELGLPFVETKAGERIDGKFIRVVEMASGRYALIRRSRDFTLVPWRPVLEHHAGKSVSGILRGDGINWTIGRSRSAPSIS
ncbi:relaxase/mobilization nuclease RlxS [Sphingosinicella sp. LHD-64]|uniref:relaxase/mobilization nuclease RlxS n=1 Tax=Sphingosinicella sp. LHD-64 TaxID=3072139 RepID=UPI00280EAF69|nr:relaxase/mobilization nuclease RlxS [Sphingosinicella sp. LHD-64]MDQ8757472.1 relaxase/mobilization nuclease RlxS [Sphingosinicella sp. LHD-64]